MNNDTFYIEQGDTSPVITAQLTDESDTPVDLEDASVRFVVSEARGGPTVLDEVANVISSTDGTVRYTWQEEDTSDFGRFRIEFVVTYKDGAKETFPNVGYHNLYVHRNLAQ